MTETRAQPSRPAWLLCRDHRPHAKIRLFCFPHCGGSPGEYVRWSDRLPDIEVIGLQLPGRGSRFAELPFSRMGELVRAICDEVDFGAEFAFLGHSMGALVAYEVARELPMRGRLGPEWLFASSSLAPAAPRPRAGLALAPDDVLLAELRTRYEFIFPEPLGGDPDGLSRSLEQCRRDLSILEGYQAKPAEPLESRILALAGDRDRVSWADLQQWGECTAARFEAALLPGGHFYWRHRDELFDVMNRVLAGPRKRL